MQNKTCAKKNKMTGGDLKKMFYPESIAVIGASSHVGNIGEVIMRNLLFNRYTGSIYPVNPKYKHCLGIKCNSSIKDIDDTVDLAIIVIPAEAIPGVLLECTDSGVDNFIIISAGFKEIGADGIKLEEDIKTISKEKGISIIGPNCLGVINTDPLASMNASFARSMPSKGNIALVSQSGAICTAILDYANGQNIGFSKFISFGNKADINENDLLSFLCNDPNTNVILVYVEELTDGRRFIDIARKMTGEKPLTPILAIKSGRTPEGAGAAASHTGALAGTDDVYDAIMNQSGVLRVDNIRDLFNFAMVFANQQLPKSNNIAIITNAGGPGIMATDSCIRYGLKLARFKDKTTQWLKEKLPQTANINNPVDVIGDAKSDRYETALNLTLSDEDVDGAMVLLTPQEMTDIEEIAKTICKASDKYPKPLLASFMGLVDVSNGVRILREHGVPHYTFPDDAARSLAAMYNYMRWVYRPRTEIKEYKVDKKRAEEIINNAVREGRRNLPEIEALQILDAYGFPVIKSIVVKDHKELLNACKEVGYPLVLKIASPDILHKTDIGGIEIGLRNEEAAKAGFDRIIENSKKHRDGAVIWGITVQQMAPDVRLAKQVILGSKRDPKFGPLIMFGLGGIYAEALKDVSFKLAPFTELSADDMIKSIRAHKILEGFRGEPPSDRHSVRECLLRLSQLVMHFSNIEELDINPLLVYSEGRGSLVVDARIILS